MSAPMSAPLPRASREDGVHSFGGIALNPGRDELSPQRCAEVGSARHRGVVRCSRGPETKWHSPAVLK